MKHGGGGEEEERETGRDLEDTRGEYEKEEWRVEKGGKRRRRGPEKENISPEILENAKLRKRDEMKTSERTKTLEKRQEE